MKVSGGQAISVSSDVRPTQRRTGLVDNNPTTVNRNHLKILRVPYEYCSFVCLFLLHWFYSEEWPGELQYPSPKSYNNSGSESDAIFQALMYSLTNRKTVSD